MRLVKHIHTRTHQCTYISEEIVADIHAKGRHDFTPYYSRVSTHAQHKGSSRSQTSPFPLQHQTHDGRTEPVYPSNET